MSAGDEVPQGEDELDLLPCGCWYEVSKPSIFKKDFEINSIFSKPSMLKQWLFLQNDPRVLRKNENVRTFAVNEDL